MEVVYMGHSEIIAKKSGKPMYIIHYAYPDARTIGMAVDKVFVLKESGIELPSGLGGGEVLDMDFNKDGFLVGLRYLEKKKV